MLRTVFILALTGLAACSGPAAEPNSMFSVESDQPAPALSELIELNAELGEALSSGADSSVVCVLSADCQATAGVLTRLKRLASSSKSSAFAAVMVSHGGLEEFNREAKFTFPVLDDCEQVIASRLSASHTPSFFVFDRDGELRFSGPMDDSTFDPGSVREQYVAAAIRALAKGDSPPKSLTPVGRPILPDHDH